MFNRRVPLALVCIGLIAGVDAETTVHQYDDGVSVTQVSPPGAVANEQILIIDNDRFGNQRVLSIGSPGGTVVSGPRPCKREQPTASMKCSGADLRNVQWEAAQLSSGQFDGADLRGASMRGARLENANFDGARLEGASLGHAELVNASFVGAKLVGARLDGANLINGDFVDADLTNASLQGSSMVNTGFPGANLSNADLRGARFINADFEMARLSGATWVDGQRCAEGSESVCRR